MSLGQSRCPAGRLTPHHPWAGRLAVALLPLPPHSHQCLAHLKPSLPAHLGWPQALLLWKLLLSWPGLPPLRPALSRPRPEQQLAALRPALALRDLCPSVGATPAAAGAAHCVESPSSLPCPALYRHVSEGVAQQTCPEGQFKSASTYTTSNSISMQDCSSLRLPAQGLILELATCTTADLWQAPTGILLPRQNGRVAGCWPS